MGWASGLQAGMRLGETLRQAQLESDLAAEAKKYKVTEGAYGPELAGNIEQLRGLQQQNPELANQYEPAIAELQRRQGLTAPDFSISSGRTDIAGGGRNFATMEEAQRGVSQSQTRGLADVYRGYGMTDKASELEARAQQQQLTGLQLRRGQREEDTENKILDIDKKAGDFMTKRLTGQDGTVRAATPDDMIAQIQHRATLLQQGGLGREATNALKDWQGVAVNAIQLQTAERNNDLGRVATAIAAGDLGPARAFYDKYVLDGAKVTNLKPNKDGSITVSRVRDDGTKLPDSRIESTGALLSTLNSFRDPMALYNYSQDQFKNNLQIRQVAASERSAASSEARAAAADKLTNAQVDFYKARTQALQQPVLSEAQVTARAKEMTKNRQINPDTDKPYTIKEATDFIKSGGRDPVMDRLDAVLGGSGADPFAPTAAPTSAAPAASAAGLSRMGTGERNPFVDASGRPLMAAPTGGAAPITRVPGAVAETVQQGLSSAQANYINYLQSKIDSNQPLTADETFRARQFGLTK